MVMSLPSSGLIAAYRRFEAWCIQHGIDPDRADIADIIDYLFARSRARQRPQRKGRR
jgi:hypothetical protein